MRSCGIRLAEQRKPRAYSVGVGLLGITGYYVNYLLTHTGPLTLALFQSSIQVPTDLLLRTESWTKDSHRGLVKNTPRESNRNKPPGGVGSDPSAVPGAVAKSPPMPCNSQSPRFEKSVL